MNYLNLEYSTANIRNTLFTFTLMVKIVAFPHAYIGDYNDLLNSQCLDLPNTCNRSINTNKSCKKKI